MARRLASMMTRLDWTLTGLVVLATFTVIFTVGVSVSASGLLPWLEGESGLPSESSSAQQTLPQSDAPGRDMPGVERYPQSVRVKYERYDLGAAEVIEVGYLTDSGIEDVSTFYEDMGQDGNWRTVGFAASQGDELGMLIARGEGEDRREVLIEVEPRGDFVSVELEEMITGSR